MANWIASRCDNTTETYVVDIKDLKNPTTGMVISADNGVTKESLVCVTLIEESLELSTLILVNGPYSSCLECFNKIDKGVGFSDCFGKNDFTIFSSNLKEVPQINKVYDINLNIEKLNITGCFTYTGYNDVKPKEGTIMNRAIVEFDSCEKCNPYKGNISKWTESISNSEKFINLRDNYIGIIK
jgi:hypothetical protein